VSNVPKGLAKERPQTKKNWRGRRTKCRKKIGEGGRGGGDSGPGKYVAYGSGRVLTLARRSKVIANPPRTGGSGYWNLGGGVEGETVQKKGPRKRSKRTSIRGAPAQQKRLWEKKIHRAGSKQNEGYTRTSIKKDSKGSTI